MMNQSLKQWDGETLILTLQSSLKSISVFQKQTLTCHKKKQQNDKCSPSKQVNRVETDDLCRSDDSQWWLKWGGRRRETHSPCLYPIPARNSSHRCLSSLLSRSLRGDTTRARKHYSAVCSGKSFATALSLSVKLIVCVHDRELCLLAFN